VLATHVNKLKPKVTVEHFLIEKIVGPQEAMEIKQIKKT
jgi:hypothetical protein